MALSRQHAVARTRARGKPLTSCGGDQPTGVCEKLKNQGWGGTVVRHWMRRCTPCPAHALRTSRIEWRRRSSQVQGRAERPVSSAARARRFAQSRSLLSVHDRKTNQLLCRHYLSRCLITATVISEQKHNCTSLRYLIVSSPPVFALPRFQHPETRCNVHT